MSRRHVCAHPIGLCVAVSVAATHCLIAASADPLQRAQQIQADIAALENEAAVYGGWAQWHARDYAFRAYLSGLMSDPAQPDVLQGHDRYLFGAYDLAFLLSGDLVYRERDNGTKTVSPVYEVVTDLARQLENRGIDLIFVPVPTRFEIYPEKLPEAPAITAPLAVNRKFLIYNLLRARVEAIDLVPAFEQAKKNETDSPLFHRASRHWAHAGVLAASEVLADRLMRYRLAESYPGLVRRYITRPMTLKSTARIAGDLPPAQREAYEAPDWRLVRVLSEDGNPVTYDEGSPVLLLGDSFVGHFASQSAGIAAHMSRLVQMPVDAAWASGGGPSVPSLLARKGPDFLEGRKVVCWIMSSRYLLPLFDKKWKSVPLP